ncbi:MAG: flagellar biosynthetic protein FliQ [Phycisphaerae bacterium]
MDSQFVLYIGKEALQTALLIAAPVLLITLVVGFLVAMLQAVTSIRDMTMGLVLKLATVGICLLVFGGWMMKLAVSFTTQIFGHMAAMGH